MGAFSKLRSIDRVLALRDGAEIKVKYRELNTREILENLEKEETGKEQIVKSLAVFKSRIEGDKALIDQWWDEQMEDSNLFAIGSQWQAELEEQTAKKN
ncbi:MAG: hypothetical protein LBQ52_04685 [Helicobacteraceae bacterium]|jgi:hypothetical protein|nr:hypothetical protein [Helicobacteraceae bacterium]